MNELSVEVYGRITSSKNGRDIWKTKSGALVNKPPKLYEAFVKSATITGWDGTMMILKGRAWVIEGYIIKPTHSGDGDNYIVALLDLLKRRGVIDDDRYFKAYNITTVVDKDCPGASVTIRLHEPDSVAINKMKTQRKKTQP